MGLEKSSDRSSGRGARRYSSPRRRQQAAETRADVLNAARVLFSERGWSRTGMRDVANAAGVSVETVYAIFGSKTDVLQAALDVAIVGDDSPVPVAERSNFAALASGRREERTRAVTRMMNSIHGQTRGLQRALREAAASDPDLARLLGENEERRRADVERGAELVYGRRPTSTQRDGLWALLSFEVYELLVERSGWSSRRYQTWLAEVLARLVDDDES
jgi:AcrR family transcriptional regulator